MGTLSGNILITGSQGQLGSELMKTLSRRGPVIGANHGDLDVTNAKSVMAYLRTTKPATVIHCAAWTDVDACEGDPDRAMAVNAEGCRIVAEGCRDIGAVMVYYSTDYVFDGLKSTPYVEEDLPAPLSIYGRSKLAGEEAVRSLVTEHIIARISWMYGGTGRNFIKSILEKGRHQLDDLSADRTVTPLRVVSDQIGCPTWAVDIANQTEILLSRRLRGTFHASSAGSVSWYQLAKEVFEYLRMNVLVEPCTTEELARPASRPRYSVMENRRLQNAGCDIMPPYRESLHRFLDQFDRARS